MLFQIWGILLVEINIAHTKASTNMGTKIKPLVCKNERAILFFIISFR